jgi:hypothetical protein
VPVHADLPFIIFREIPASLAQPDIFPNLMGADIGGIDVTHGVSRDPRCRSAAVDSVQIGWIGNKGAQRTVNGAADDDAAQLAGLRSRRLVATCRLVSERGADIKRIVRPDIDRAWLAELMPGGDEIAVLIENLDATVATIGNIDTPERAADENVVRIIEIAGSRSLWPQVLMNRPSLENLRTRPLFDLFGEWPSETKISPLGATATPVGRSKVSVPLPPTPILPSIIRTLPFWSSLRTS